MPFDHTLRKVAHRSFTRRLIQERWLYESFRPTLGRCVTIVIYSDSDRAKFGRTLESCLLQSAIGFNILVITRTAEIQSTLVRLTQERLERSPYLENSFKARISFVDSLSELFATEDILGEFLLFARSGDVLHPSLVTSFHLELLNSPSVAVCLWNDITVDFRKSMVLRLTRKPEFERFTLFHLNYISYNFACRKRLVSSYSEIETCFDKNDGHFFLLSLIEKHSQNFVTIPQYLYLRDCMHARENRDYIRPFWESYEKYFARHGFALEATQKRYYHRLVPREKPSTVSVIVPFRDKPEITCAAVRSILDQDIEAFIEVILVNNQSESKCIEDISRFIEKHHSHRWIIRTIDYNLPFNHSAQCNLAVREAIGECLVFLNNDAALATPKTLLSMSSWSLVPGVGTVGVRIVDTRNRLVSAGIDLQLRLSHERAAVVQESVAVAFAYYNRQTWGNSFACAAISRKNFDLVGPLDDINFPIGYNDVDYNERCRKAGLRNVYLGSVTAVHTPAASRGASDELYQILLLRRKYPELFRESLFQLAAEIPARPGRISRAKRLVKSIYRRLTL